MGEIRRQIQAKIISIHKRNLGSVILATRERRFRLGKLCRRRTPIRPKNCNWRRLSPIKPEQLVLADRCSPAIGSCLDVQAANRIEPLSLEPTNWQARTDRWRRDELLLKVTEA
jgi:hypothetical protein